MSLALDIVLVVVLLAALVHGWRSGLVRSAGSVAGLVAGGCGAAVLAPLAGSITPPGARVAVGVAAAIVLVLIGWAIGTRVGATVGGLVDRSPLGPFDRILGAVAQLAIGAAVLAVLASIAIAQHTPVVAQPAARSVVLHTIGAITPAPVERTIAQITAAADTGDVFRIRSPFTGEG